jgi:hypothetical protein
MFNNRQKFKILSINHYSMDNGQRGASAVIEGNCVDTNNKIGVDIMECKITDYGELQYLKSLGSKSYPAIFEGNVGFASSKNRAGKAVMTNTLSDLELVSTLVSIDKKEYTAFLDWQSKNKSKK